jgi:glutathione-regulated potassium-efflux system protein KefB
MIGFGRVGQIASQVLLARGHSVSIIDTDDDMIRVAGYMGFKVFFGDGTRLDILHAAGAAGARAILVCVDKPETATRIVEVCKSEFGRVPVLARAFDRAHALALIRAGADWQLRETFESALLMGREALEQLGETEDAIAEVLAEVRLRDGNRMAAQVTGDLTSGRELLLSNLPDHLRDELRAKAPQGLSGTLAGAANASRS